MQKIDSERNFPEDMPPAEDQSFGYHLHESNVPVIFEWQDKFIEIMHIEVRNNKENWQLRNDKRKV